MSSPFLDDLTEGNAREKVPSRALPPPRIRPKEDKYQKFPFTNSGHPTDIPSLFFLFNIEICLFLSAVRIYQMEDEICERGIRDNATDDPWAFSSTAAKLPNLYTPATTVNSHKKRRCSTETVSSKTFLETRRVVGMRGINLWPATKRRVISFRPIFR